MTTAKTRFAGAVSAGLLLAALPACSKTEMTTEARDQGAGVVSVSDQWAKAASTGMTGLFGTLKNSGATDVTVVSAASPSAGQVELHEVVGQQGSAAMQPKEGGFRIPAGGTHVLAPGGDHLMLMNLTAPLTVGSQVEVTLTFADGTSLPFAAQVRDFSGAGETYQPSGHAGGHG
ncbi:copper chaperone PCu(A)C [Mycolicibacterium sp.]|uniref:copper chaperone PCu(A)C n=1 Tax=Mycolicibacterium sp. TaxID=2320850 RepID=UPI0028A581AE|nr:copper chaperone PCu(A)C [Mycolicibacterium sp.]